jgi:O-antigen/teichoic acid export membrane protein
MTVKYGAYLKKVGLSSLINSGTSALATVILLPLVIKSVGLESYGFWAMLTIFVGIAAALDFGIWKSLIYLIPRKRHSRNELLTSAIILCALGWLLFAVILEALLLAGVHVFGSLVGREGNLVWWLATGGCVIVLASLLTNLARGVLEASYRGHWVNIGYALLTLSLYGVAAGISQYSHNPRLLILGSVFVYLVFLVAHFACLTTDSIHWERPQREAVISILRYGTASFVADAPVIMLGPMISYLFVLVAKDGGEYGAFDIALRVATLAATTLALISAPFFTIVSSASDGAQSEVRGMISRQLRLTLGLALIGWISYWALAKPLLALFFSQRSDDIYRASVIMLLGTFAVAALEPVTRMLMGIGRLGKLSLVRSAMLASALLSVALLAGVGSLDRFAISCAVGFGVSALGLLLLNKSERWGYSA